MNDDIGCECLVEGDAIVYDFIECGNPVKYKAPEGKPWKGRLVCGVHKNMIDKQAEKFGADKCTKLS